MLFWSSKSDHHCCHCFCFNLWTTSRNSVNSPSFSWQQSNIWKKIITLRFLVTSTFESKHLKELTRFAATAGVKILQFWTTLIWPVVHWGPDPSIIKVWNLIGEGVQEDARPNSPRSEGGQTLFAIVLNKDFQKTWPTPTLEILAWFYRNSVAPQLNCTEKTMEWEWGST